MTDRTPGVGAGDDAGTGGADGIGGADGVGGAPGTGGAGARRDELTAAALADDLSPSERVEFDALRAAADVAVAALTDDRHVGRLYELTGPRSLSFAEAAAEIGAAAGCTVRYTPVSFEEHEAELAARGVAPEVIELLTYVFGEVVDGRNADTTDGVRRALGREPRDFADYCRATAGAGAWNLHQRDVA